MQNVHNQKLAGSQVNSNLTVTILYLSRRRLEMFINHTWQSQKLLSIHYLGVIKYVPQLKNEQTESSSSLVLLLCPRVTPTISAQSRDVKCACGLY